MAKELTFTNYISIDGAEPVRMDSLSPEELQYCREKMAENMGRVMSDYYSNHMEEYPETRWGRALSEKLGLMR